MSELPGIEAEAGTVTEAPAKTAPADAVELMVQQEAARTLWQDIALLPSPERTPAAREWAREYGHLFLWCCGQPVFDNEEELTHLKRGVIDDHVYWQPA